MDSKGNHHFEPTEMPPPDVAGPTVHRAMPGSGWGGVCLALVLLTGCTAYRPQPLSRDAVEKRLQQPTPAELQILAAQIDHPLLPPAALHPDQDLTPDSAAILAVLLNPDLRTARDRRGLAAAQLLAAGLLPDPELDLGLELPTGAGTGKVTAYGLGLNWEASALLARAPRQDRARAAQQQVDLAVAWQEWQVAQGAKAAVYRLKILEDQLDLVREERARTGETLERVAREVTAGGLTDVDLQAARTADVKARTGQLELEKQALAQRRKLRQLLGLPAEADLRLAKTIRLPEPTPAPPAAALLTGLEQRRLDLLALRRGYASQEGALRAAVLEQFPKIRLGPTFHRDTDGVRTIGFSVAIDLPIFDRNRGRIAEAQATRQLLFDEYANRVFEARSDIAALREGLGIAGEQLALARATAAQNQERAQNYAGALADGRIDGLAAASAWQDWADARMRELQRAGELVQAQVALQLAAGFYRLPPPEMAGRKAAAAVQGDSP